MTTWEDPIVAEVRKARDTYAKKFNYDIESICRDLRQRQETSGHPIVRLDEQVRNRDRP